MDKREKPEWGRVPRKEERVVPVMVGRGVGGGQFMTETFVEDVPRPPPGLLETSRSGVVPSFRGKGMGW